MSQIEFPDMQVDEGGGGKILLVVFDGLGGLPHPDTGLTELETARTPVLDDLASRSSLGMLLPAGQGITPGSGPGHLALFGYDPTRYVIGRGALSALGVGFDLRAGDVAARLNLATVDGHGRVVDRRAGRPTDAEGRRVVARVLDGIVPPDGIEVFLEHEKEHRAVLILRGSGLEAEVSDTDPQETGVPPLEPEALTPGSRRTAGVLGELLAQARRILADEQAANAFLARGIAAHQAFPGFRDRFGLRAAAVARYPMYRGVARLVGMDVPGVPTTDAEAVSMAAAALETHDFCFLHYKTPDARGEDRDFPGKVAAIEAMDALLPELVEKRPAVFAVTGDHSTPATFGAHSWHAVPVLLASRWSRPTAQTFGEGSCRGGDLGVFDGKHLMGLALAHAERLSKFGA